MNMPQDATTPIGYAWTTSYQANALCCLYTREGTARQNLRKNAEYGDVPW